MVIKISALIYTIASITVITLMIMRPAVEVETHLSDPKNIHVNNDSAATQTDVTSTSAATLETNMEVTTPASDTLPETEVAPSVDATTTVAPVIESAETAAPASTTEVITAPPLNNGVSPTNSTEATIPAAPIVTTPDTAMPVPVPVNPAIVIPSNPPIAPTNPSSVITPSLTPVEATPTTIMPQSNNSLDTETQAITDEAQALTATQVAAPSVTNPTSVDGETPTFPNTDAIVTNISSDPTVVEPPSLPLDTPLSSNQLTPPSNVIDAPLAEEIKKK